MAAKKCIKSGESDCVDCGMCGLETICDDVGCPIDIYKALVAIATDISKTGISKSRNNQQQGYKFRGIDDVYNEMAPILSKHNVVVLPFVLNRSVTERQTQKGGTLFYVTVEVDFCFV